MPTETILSTITSKGQLTLPVAIRRRLGVSAQDRVAFVIDEQGKIELKVPTYATVASVTGAVPALDRPLDFSSMRRIAYEDRVSGEGDVASGC